METILVEMPDSLSEFQVVDEIIYQVPANVLVIDAETKEVLKVDKITSSMMKKVILAPAIAGGH